MTDADFETFAKGEGDIVYPFKSDIAVLEALLGRLHERLNVLIRDAKLISHYGHGGMYAPILRQLETHFIPGMEAFMDGQHQAGNLQSLIDLCEEDDGEEDK